MADLPQWSDIVARAGNVPDDQLKAMQAGYFQSVLWPEMVRTGANPMQMGAAMQEWMQMSDRTDRSSMPRARVFGTSAAAALARPVVSIASEAADKPEWRKNLNEWEQAAATEAQRQGINPAVPQFVGGLVGAAPYFAPVGKAIQGLGLAGAAADIATGAVGAGAYEAAAAEPGKREEAAMQGVAMGAAVPAALHGLGKVLVRFKASGATGELPAAAAEQAVKQGAAEVVNDAAVPKELLRLNERGPLPRSRQLPAAPEQAGPFAMPGDQMQVGGAQVGQPQLTGEVQPRPTPGVPPRGLIEAPSQIQMPGETAPIPMPGQTSLEQQVVSPSDPRVQVPPEASAAGMPEPASPVSPVLPAAPGESGAASGVESPAQVAQNGVANGQPEPTFAAGEQGTGVPGEVAPIPEPRGPAYPITFGKETTVRVPGEDRAYQARYAVRELDDVAASHNGWTFQENPNYQLKNDRNYSDPRNQERILKQHAQFDPEYLLADAPHAGDGAPVIDSDGNVLGGNSRTMTLERVYQSKNQQAADYYKRMLMGKAKQFGIDPETVLAMKRPVLVREIPDAEWERLGAAGKGDAVTNFNKVGAAPLTTAEQALADARRVSPELLDFIDQRIAEAGDDATLNAALSGKAGAQIIREMIDTGVISEKDAGAWMTPQKVLTQYGKDRVSKMLLGRMFDSVDQMDRLAPSLRNKLERAAAPLARLGQHPEWDIYPRVKQAISALEEMHAQGFKSIPDMIDHGNMFADQSFPPEVLRLARAIEKDSPNQLGQRFRAMAAKFAEAQDIAREKASPQNAMFGDFFKPLPEPPTPSGAYDQALGDVQLATANKTAQPGTSPAAQKAFGGPKPLDGYTRVYLSGKTDPYNNAVGYLDPFAAQARAGERMRYVDVPDQFLPHLQRANAPGELRVPSYLETEAKPVDPKAQDGVIPLRNRPTGTLGATGGYTIDPSITGVPSETAGKVAGVTWKSGPGQASTIQATLARDTTFHESLHRSIIQNNLDNPEQILGAVDPGMSTALRAALPQASGVYDRTANEEIFTRLQTAVRVGDQATLKKFADADTSEEHVLNYAVDQAKTVQAELARKPDTPARKIAERKLQDTIRRANRSLDDLQAQLEFVGAKVETEDGFLRYTEPGKKAARVFDDRAALDKALDDLPAFPEAPEHVNASEALPGTPGLPPAGGPNSARFNTFGEPGVPIEDINTPRRPVAAGVHGLSFYFRPFLGWLSDVAKKHDWPELYAAGEHFDLAAKDMSDWMHEWVDTKAADALKGLAPKRYKDVWEYLTLKEQVAGGKASKDALDTLASGLKLTQKEIESTNKVRGWLDEVGKELNIDPLTWISDYLPRLRKSNYDPDVLATMAKTPDQIKFFAEMERLGEMNNRETNLAAILYNYARLGAKKKFLNEPYQAMKGIIDGTTNVEDRLSRWTVLNKPAPDAGLLKLALERHLDYMAGRPDYSQKLLESAVQSSTAAANKFIEGVNGKLPAWAKLGKIETPPAEVIRKLMTLQTAGGLGFRAFVPLRDLFGGLLTAYPVAGEVYYAKGIKAAATKAGWALADKYGAVAKSSDYMNLMTAGSEAAQPGMVSKIAQASLEPTRWGHNVARVATFNAFFEKIKAAVPELRASGDLQKFTRNTGMGILDPQMKAGLTMEIASALQTGGNVEAAVGRIANRLTEATQFSFTKGAQAGLYKTGVGRLFGQYGTWPLGYVQWMRKIATADMDQWQRAAMLTRLAASHTAVLAAGQAMGVDLSSMVFTTPMEWAGGPLLQVGLAVPHAVGDFSKPEGAEARHKIGRALQTFVPGFTEAEGITKAVLDDDPDWYLRALGIPKLTPSKKAQPLYKGLDTLEGN